jgi:hypothetical protein
MKVKIFSVKIRGERELYGDWKPCIIDELTKKLEVEKGGWKFSGDEYLERAIQSFLDEHPKIKVKHGQYATTPIYFGEHRAGPRWVIEKSVVIFYDEE